MMMMPQQPNFASFPQGQAMPYGQPMVQGRPPAPQPVRWPTQPQAAPRPAQVPQLAQAPQPQPRPQEMPRPDVVRGVPREERSFAMPSPESLNIGTGGGPAARARNELDWTSVRAQLNRIGATSFQLENLPQGGCRFRCLVPDANRQPCQIEGQGADEAEAVQRCLAQVSR